MSVLLATALAAFNLTVFCIRSQASFRRFWVSKPAKKATLFSRYHVPWDIVEKRALPTLAESRGNVLYSAISATATDGLGHSMATFNAEVFTAYHLGLAYSHRVATFGSLTRHDSLAVDKFFGLGDGEVNRQELQSDVCDIPHEQMDVNIHAVKGKRVCPICTKLRAGRGNKFGVKTLVRLPKVVVTGRQSNVPKLRQLCSATTSTLFTMDAGGCDKMPALSDFSVTGAIFYWKYWHKHGVNKHGAPLRKRRPGQQHQTRAIPYRDGELTIAVHIRRGDFLAANSTRTATSSAVFVSVVRGVLRAARANGDALSALPPAVHIYSEGVAKRGAAAAGWGGPHDVAAKDPVYADVDGRRQGAAWWRARLAARGGGGARARARVVMHVAEQTLGSVHEMASADVFVGSLSGLSRNVVRSVGRGAMVLPCPYMNQRADRRRFTCFDERGAFDERQFGEQWRAYAAAHEPFVV